MSSPRAKTILTLIFISDPWTNVSVLVDKFGRKMSVTGWFHWEVSPPAVGHSLLLTLDEIFCTWSSLGNKCIIFVSNKIYPVMSTCRRSCVCGMINWHTQLALRPPHRLFVFLLVSKWFFGEEHGERMQACSTTGFDGNAYNRVGVFPNDRTKKITKETNKLNIISWHRKDLWSYQRVKIAHYFYGLCQISSTLSF